MTLHDFLVKSVDNNATKLRNLSTVYFSSGRLIFLYLSRCGQCVVRQRLRVCHRKVCNECLSVRLLDEVVPGHDGLEALRLVLVSVSTALAERDVRVLI